MINRQRNGAALILCDFCVGAKVSSATAVFWEDAQHRKIKIGRTMTKFHDNKRCPYEGVAGRQDDGFRLFIWPLGPSITADRIARLRSRIDQGLYPIEHRLIADAILHNDTQVNGVKCLTAGGDLASND